MRAERTPGEAAVSEAYWASTGTRACPGASQTNSPVPCNGRVCFGGPWASMQSRKRNETAQWACTSESHSVNARLVEQSRLYIIPQPVKS